jgi:hypothetical protein
LESWRREKKQALALKNSWSKSKQKTTTAKEREEDWKKGQERKEARKRYAAGVQYPEKQEIPLTKRAKKELTNPFSQKVDRNRRRHDRNHGPLSKLQPHHHTNRTGEIQIPHSLFSASEDRKGVFLSFLFLSPHFPHLPTASLYLPFYLQRRE